MRSSADFHGYGNPGRYALLSVSDSGLGMDEATRERIFDPFFTTKEVGKGTGLGLSTVYGIVKQHGGYITVYSEPRMGTTFHIYLPAVRAEGGKEAEHRAAVRGGRETILVAEDNEGVRDLICRVLGNYGYTTIPAIDGAEAVDLYAKAGRIDMLILDSVMPKKNGREAFDEIQRLKPGVRVLFTSGYTRDVFTGKGIEDERFHFLHKPISPTLLLHKVREILDE
jgi:CheY-like chemotaxis protein